VAPRSLRLAIMAMTLLTPTGIWDNHPLAGLPGLASVTGTATGRSVSAHGPHLSYQGELLKAFYAARTARSPWRPMVHAGRPAMSQEGAQNLALSGLTYNQILGRYTTRERPPLAPGSRSVPELSASGRRPWSAATEVPPGQKFSPPDQPARQARGLGSVSVASPLLRRRRTSQGQQCPPRPKSFLSL